MSSSSSIRLGGTACVSTRWISDSSMSCKPANGYFSPFLRPKLAHCIIWILSRTFALSLYHCLALSCKFWGNLEHVWTDTSCPKHTYQLLCRWVEHRKGSRVCIMTMVSSKRLSAKTQSTLWPTYVFVYLLSIFCCLCKNLALLLSCTIMCQQ